ncbi:DUF1510 family protein [Lentibacillus cibarius]|uniref:DUF1510 family protein n=1 Tax=Lentibacillus cibarius TaxID=2583219 RepID=A0A549YLM3_9BACI|nr:DUF1510 family protein [Lentibacillus cibarius]TRM08760.1 DUF1510 family protein [Lentibacillus cibarius]TRM12782.1 DUF1510 family protein [Lentibacillus cibarius]
MSDHNELSRVNKYEKKRKNTKSLSVFIVLGSILVIALVILFIFGGDDQTDSASNGQKETEQDTQASSKENESDNNSSDDVDKPGNKGAEQDNGEDNSEDTGSSERIATEKVEPSDDNVIEAYKGDWKPVDTEQSEPHTINFDEGSQDREEMRQAVTTATDLNEDKFVMWWIARNGEQKAIATVSSDDESDIYRVYLSWVSNQGWKPTKVERLKENDQKWRFE